MKIMKLLCWLFGCVPVTRTVMFYETWEEFFSCMRCKRKFIRFKYENPWILHKYNGER